MAKVKGKTDKAAENSDTVKDLDAPVEAKISDDVVDAEIVEDLPKDETAEAPDDSSAGSIDTDVVDEPPEEVAEETKGDASSSDDTGEQNDTSSDNNLVDNTPESETRAAEKSTETPTVKKTGFVPVVLGGAVAAALGFGVAQYLGPLNNEKDPALTALESTVAAQAEQIQTLLSEQSKTQAALADANAALQSTDGSLDGLTGAMATANGRIDDVAGALATLDGRIAIIEKQPITQSLPSAAIEAYEREVEELKAAVANQRAEAATMEENAKLTAQQALARAALSRILSALDTGAAYRVALSDFSTATGMAAPADLESFADTGVTTLATLQNDFPAAARSALASARAGDPVEGNKLTSFFKSQLGARSVTPQEGTNPDAILSRAEAALRAGHVTDALAEIATLPEAAQADLSAWVAQAEARQAALSAGEALSQKLNSN